jgi:hypothetical protein
MKQLEWMIIFSFGSFVLLMGTVFLFFWLLGIANITQPITTNTHNQSKKDNRIEKPNKFLGIPGIILAT